MSSTAMAFIGWFTILAIYCDAIMTVFIMRIVLRISHRIDDLELTAGLEKKAGENEP